MKSKTFFRSYFSLNYLHRLASGAVIGMMLFLAFVFAPMVFRVLERAEAAQLQAAIFPVYFILCSVSVLVLLFVRVMQLRKLQASERRGLWPHFALLLPCFLIFEYSARFLSPAISDQVRRSIEEGTRVVSEGGGFSLHAQSVTLNAVALLLLLVYLGLREPFERE